MRVGVFDSGLGGLSVLREILHQAPALDLIYYADQAHLPWGPLPTPLLRSYCENITEQLAARGCTHIVLACNTASAAALQELRATFPKLQFVGMEPAIKPASKLTQNGIVGLLATPATLQGELLTQTRARHAGDIEILSDPCSGLVDAIESADDIALRRCLERILPPMLEAQADVLVLGCTHYPFALDAIQAITGPHVKIVDPAPAVAAQLLRLLPQNGDSNGSLRLFSSGDALTFATRASALLGRSLGAEYASWSTASR